LYIAYNKDAADVYSVNKALNSGFYRLYSTAQDVVEKKKIAIDNAVAERAVAEAELALKNSMERINSGLTYEEELSDASKRQAMQLILDNSEHFDSEVVDDALKELNSQMHEPLIPQYEVNELLEDSNDSSVEANYSDDLASMTTEDKIG
jgi:hypothetical protein